MNTETHRQRANDIWNISNLLRGPYTRNEYGKVVLPLTVLPRFDCPSMPEQFTMADFLDRKSVV